MATGANSKIEKLLRNYPTLKEYADKTRARLDGNAISERELLKLIRNPYYNPDESVESIQWCVDVVTRVQQQLESWLSDGYENGRIRWRLITGLYLDTRRITLKELSVREHIPIYKLSVQLDKAKTQLTWLVFGAPR